MGLVKGLQSRKLDHVTPFKLLNITRNFARKFPRRHLTDRAPNFPIRSWGRQIAFTKLNIFDI
jgi:hypothetical protein